MKSQTNQISRVAATAVSVKAVRSSSIRAALALNNVGPNTVFLVTDPEAPASTGFPLKMGDSVTWLCADGFAGLIKSDIYAICNSAETASLGVIECFVYGD